MLYTCQIKTVRCNEHSALKQSALLPCQDSTLDTYSDDTVQCYFSSMHMACTPVQYGTNIQIFKYIRIYLDKYIYSSKYSLIFPRQIYSDIHSPSIYADKYIRIFIHPIFFIANIFEFSLFPKKG